MSPSTRPTERATSQAAQREATLSGRIMALGATAMRSAASEQGGQQELIRHVGDRMPRAPAPPFAQTT